MLNRYRGVSWNRYSPDPPKRRNLRAQILALIPTAEFTRFSNQQRVVENFRHIDASRKGLANSRRVQKHSEAIFDRESFRQVDHTCLHFAYDRNHVLIFWFMPDAFVGGFREVGCRPALNAHTADDIRTYAWFYLPPALRAKRHSGWDELVGKAENTDFGKGPQARCGVYYLGAWSELAHKGGR
jgi:hypothetical protein